jgi:hypothetical protein
MYIYKKRSFFSMFSRLTLLSVAFAFVFLTACAGSKGGPSSRGGDGGDYDEDDPPPRADQLKEAKSDAVNLTEENHKMAREIFELKNKLGMPTD